MSVDDWVGRRVLAVHTLPPIEGVITATFTGKTTGRLWLTITDDDGTDHDVTLGELLFL